MTPIVAPVAPMSVAPVEPVVPVVPQPVAPEVVQPSIPPVNTGAPVEALPSNFADALRPATPADVARYEQPQAAPLTPEQIQNTMNPLSGLGY